MLSSFHTANQSVDEMIKILCKKLDVILDRTGATDPSFPILVDAIAKLRASKNVPIIMQDDPSSAESMSNPS